MFNNLFKYTKGILTDNIPYTLDDSSNMLDQANNVTASIEKAKVTSLDKRDFAKNVLVFDDAENSSASKPASVTSSDRKLEAKAVLMDKYDPIETADDVFSIVEETSVLDDTEDSFMTRLNKILNPNSAPTPKAVPPEEEKVTLYKQGVKYYTGDGVETDRSKAFLLFKRSADMYYVPAYVYLGECYLHGYGTPRDDSQAFQKFFVAANMKDPEGQYRLARIHHLGIGGQVSLNDARLWYEESAKQNHPKAKQILKQLPHVEVEPYDIIGKLEQRLQRGYSKAHLIVLFDECWKRDCLSAETYYRISNFIPKDSKEYTDIVTNLGFDYAYKFIYTPGLEKVGKDWMRICANTGSVLAEHYYSYSEEEFASMLRKLKSDGLYKGYIPSA